MKIDFKYIRPLLHYRFKPFGYALEQYILNFLGKHFYEGNKATWEAHRRAAYYQYHTGAYNKVMANEHRVPLFVVEWWVSIWRMYDNAWGWIEER